MTSEFVGLVLYSCIVCTKVHNICPQVESLNKLSQSYISTMQGIMHGASMSNYAMITM